MNIITRYKIIKNLKVILKLIHIKYPKSIRQKKNITNYLIVTSKTQCNREIPT